MPTDTLAPIFIVGAILVIGMLFSFGINSSATPQTEIGIPQKMTLTGAYVCLPRTNASIVHIEEEECVPGITVSSGEYYAINFELTDETPVIEVGDKITAGGVFMPIVDLRTDYWDLYPIEGVFSVTDTLTVIRR